MQSAAKNAMASRMLSGGSGGLSPESFWKKTNQGNLMPACRKTPADAAVRPIQTQNICWSAAAWLIIDFDTKPDVKGKAEMASAPTIPMAVVNGMLLKSPPRSEQRRTPPVISSTEPADINSRAL